MGVLVRILAAVFIANVILVAAFGVLIEARRRRDRRQLRALEVLWRSPSTSADATRARGGGVRVRGRHEVVVVPEAPRHGMVRTVSLVLALASVVAVAAVGIFDPAGPRSAPRSLHRPMGDGSAPRSTDPDESRDELQLTTPQDATGVEQDRDRVTQGADPETPTGADDGASNSEESVPAAVVAAASSTTEIRLDWAEVPEAIAYRVDRREEGEIWLKVALRSAGISRYTDTGLVPGTTYYYRVTAQLEDGWASASDVVSATTVTAPPAAPVLTGKARNGGIILAWTDVEDETGYRVERQLEGESIWTAIATTGEGIVEYRDGNLTPGALYRYRIVTIGPGGESPPSNVVQVTAWITVAEGVPGKSGDELPGNKPAKEQAIPGDEIP